MNRRERAPWTPAFSCASAVAIRGWDIIHKIADLVYKRVCDRDGRGACDEALLFAYLACVDQRDRWFEAAWDRLEQAVEGTAPTDYSLQGGLCGLGWTIEHLFDLFAEASVTGVGEVR